MHTLTFEHRLLHSPCQYSRSKPSCTAPERNQDKDFLWMPDDKEPSHQMLREEFYQEDQTMQEQGVEESDSPGHLVGENHPPLRDKDERMRPETEPHT